MEVVKMNRRRAILLVILIWATLFPLSAVAEAGMVYRYKLIAGQDIQVGTVEVWNTADTLYIKYDMWSPSYCLKATQLHVADSLEEIPHNNGGPIPGRFDYKMQHDCSTPEVLYEIPLSAGGWEIGDRVVMVAHAVVGRPADPYWEETAWGVQCGDFATWHYPGSRWSAYMEYPIHQ
jgi:hypothetical protein